MLYTCSNKITDVQREKRLASNHTKCQSPCGHLHFIDFVFWLQVQKLWLSVLHLLRLLLYHPQLQLYKRYKIKQKLRGKKKSTTGFHQSSPLVFTLTGTQAFCRISPYENSFSFHTCCSFCLEHCSLSHHHLSMTPQFNQVTLLFFLSPLLFSFITLSTVLLCIWFCVYFINVFLPQRQEPHLFMS